MSQSLYKGLVKNGVKLDEKFSSWTKEEMVRRLATVMGMQQFCDPDESYVLTVDNLIKILAIQMRFRYMYCMQNL